MEEDVAEEDEIYIWDHIPLNNGEIYQPKVKSVYKRAELTQLTSGQMLA